MEIFNKQIYGTINIESNPSRQKIGKGIYIEQNQKGIVFHRVDM